MSSLNPGPEPEEPDEDDMAVREEEQRDPEREAKRGADGYGDYFFLLMMLLTWCRLQGEGKLANKWGTEAEGAAEAGNTTATGEGDGQDRNRNRKIVGELVDK